MNRKDINPYERIEAILDLYGLSANAFAKQIGIGRPETLYNIKDGKTKSITVELALKIQAVFSAIDLNWLLTGEGRMINIPKGSDDFVCDKDKVATIKKYISDLEQELKELKIKIERITDGNA